jgi:translation initiation factor IF-3
MGHVDQEPKMAGRNINMQISPHPEKQRVRKFANFKHGKFIDPEEEDNEHEEDDHEHGAANHNGKVNGNDGAKSQADANQSAGVDGSGAAAATQPAVTTAAV